MTLKEKVTELYPHNMNDNFVEGVKGCPCDYECLRNHGGDIDLCNFGISCYDCWNREYKDDDNSNTKMISSSKESRVKILKNYQRTYTDSTLMGFSKAKLIEHIRVLEHNINVQEECIRNQREYMKGLLKQGDE